MLGIAIGWGKFRPGNSNGRGKIKTCDPRIVINRVGKKSRKNRIRKRISFARAKCYWLYLRPMTIDIGLAIGLGILSILMAVIGGVIATQQKGVRVSFMVMGALSVVFVIFQTVRATKSQDALASSIEQLQESQSKLVSAQAALGKQQTALQGLTTGGEAYPSLWIISSLDPAGNPYGDATFYLQNHDATNSLYSVSIPYVAYANHGELLCRNLDLRPIPFIPEIPPGGQANIGDFSFKDPIEKYELGVRARNGSFVISAKRTGKEWIVTIKREGSDTVLEQTEQDVGKVFLKPPPKKR